MTESHSHLRPPIGSHDHIQGSATAPLTLVEYGDYQCPYCGQAHPIVKRVQKWIGPKMRFVFRNFPLAEIHPFAMGAAEMAEAAAIQEKFWQMHDVLYEHQGNLEPEYLLEYAKRLKLDLASLKTDVQSESVVERVRSDFASGVRSGVNGTPTFFINGVRFDGNWSDERSLISALEAAG